MKIVINIEAEFGSNFQEEVGLKVIEVVMEAMRLRMLSTHKKNKLDYTILTETNKKVKFQSTKKIKL